MASQEGGMGRRDFLKVFGVGGLIAAGMRPETADAASAKEKLIEEIKDKILLLNWRKNS